jgi:hypothetical protein
MPASIRIESGIAAGTNYWIDRPVLRIGSDPQCEICVPTADLAPHALTLEFRDGNYRAYNRGSTPVNIGAAIVQPGAIGVWQGDQTVHLPGDLRLLLEIDGDPRPSPRPEARVDDDYVRENGAALADSDSAAGEATAKKSSGSLIQLGIIGFCILGMGAFLTMGGDGEPAGPARPTFEAIVESSLAKKEDPSRAFLPRLQYAQAALVRGHTELARTRFLKLRDQLVRHKESLPTGGRAETERMLDYVEYRLSGLQ